MRGRTERTPHLCRLNVGTLKAIRDTIRAPVLGHLSSITCQIKGETHLTPSTQNSRASQTTTRNRARARRLTSNCRMNQSHHAQQACAKVIRSREVFNGFQGLRKLVEIRKVMSVGFFQLRGGEVVVNPTHSFLNATGTRDR